MHMHAIVVDQHSAVAELPSAVHVILVSFAIEVTEFMARMSSDVS